MKDKKYFDESVDKAIIDFQTEQDLKKRNKIFEVSIMPAFQKLISYYYFTMPVARDEEIQFDCLSFLFEQLKKFDISKTSKSRGFPYFNMVAKNYFIQRLKQEKKRNMNNEYVFSLNDPLVQDDELLSGEDVESVMEIRQFIDLFKQNLEKWREVFQKEQEKAVIEALIILFENVENIDIFNEKAVFHYLKEITGLNSTQIAINLAKVRKKFFYFHKKYERGDF